MFDKTRAEQHLNKLLKQHKIRVFEWSKTSCGLARWYTREIKIPKPIDTDTFCVGMHEIKHIIDGDVGKRFEQEFDCDMYAYKQARMLAFDKLDEWNNRTKWHVLSRIAMAHNRGYNVRNMRGDIKEFFSEVNWSKWSGNRVFIYRDRQSVFGYYITFSPMMSSRDINLDLNKIGLKLIRSDYDDSTYNKWLVCHVNSSNIQCNNIQFNNLSEVVLYFGLSNDN